MRNPDKPFTVLEKLALWSIPIGTVSLLTEVIFDFTGWTQIIIGTICVGSVSIGFFSAVFALMEQ
jgi:hypothetical protein